MNTRSKNKHTCVCAYMQSCMLLRLGAFAPFAGGAPAALAHNLFVPFIFALDRVVLDGFHLVSDLADGVAIGGFLQHLPKLDQRILFALYEAGVAPVEKWLFAF